MTPTSAKYARHDGHPYLEIEFAEPELPTGYVSTEVWLHLETRKWNAVHLGPGWDNLVSATINGREFSGVTDNPAVVKLSRQFLKDLKNKTFEDGKVLYP